MLELSLEIQVEINKLSNCVLIALAVEQKSAMLELPGHFLQDTDFLFSQVLFLFILCANIVSSLFL